MSTKLALSKSCFSAFSWIKNLNLNFSWKPQHIFNLRPIDFNAANSLDYEHHKLNLKCFSRTDKTIPFIISISFSSIYPDIIVTSIFIHA